MLLVHVVEGDKLSITFGIIFPVINLEGISMILENLAQIFQSLRFILWYMLGKFVKVREQEYQI